MKKEVIASVMLLMILCVSCRQNQNQPFVRTVKTTHPVRVEPVVERTLPGIVKENQIINLGFKTGGQISHIYVKEGDYVREGQVLARLDDKDYLLQLSATEIQYNQLKTEAARREALHNRNRIAGNDYDKALAAVQGLEVQLQGYRNTVAYTVLEAPSAGYIQSVNFRKPEMVDAGRPVFTLMDVSSVVIETDLPANLYLQRERFDGISCRTNVLPGEEFPLKILSISHKSNGSQLYKMSLTALYPTNNPLTAGMNVEVSIILQNGEEVLRGCALPVNCVFMEDGKQYVRIVSPESTVRKREVHVNGLNDKGNIVVTGVEPEDNVVSAGVQYLQENEKVTVITTTKTNVGGAL